jgi:hypothetical protein
MANTSISLVSLDFDTIKNNLKQYLKNQAIFSDYDFEGSNFSVLLDVLAYNTYLNSYYLNMIASEMFLDSAQLRNSVISHAKTLNYLPTSRRSAVASITCTFAQSGLDVFEIPRGTRFSGQNSNSTFTFVTDESVVLYPSSNTFVAENLKIYEGTNVTESFIVDNSVINQRFILSNDTLDTDSVYVLVSENNGQSNSEFIKATSYFNVANTSNVFFIQAADNDLYELTFGDDIIGRKPTDGALIQVTYRLTGGDIGNGAKGFTLVDNLGSYNGYGSAIIPNIDVVDMSAGGSERETTDKIKKNATKWFQTQERAITTSDFKTLILQHFPSVKDVHVYGGETATDEIGFGKVYVCPVTQSGYALTDSEKYQIEVFLKERMTLGLIPAFVDPDILYLQLNILVKYKSSSTIKSPADITTSVKNTVIDFNNNYLESFDTEFKYSQLLEDINNSDTSISSNEVDVILKKISTPTLNLSESITVNFRNKIKTGSLYSSIFSTNGRLYSFTDYNPNNNTLTLTQTSMGLNVINNSSNLYLKDVTTVGKETYSLIGTIDYTNGNVSINNIIINSFEDSEGIEFYVIAEEQNVFAKQNDVIEIDVANGIAITIESV